MSSQNEDLLGALAKTYDLSPQACRAVLQVESGGRGFANDGRMTIRFEVHVFHKKWGLKNPEAFREHFRFNSKRKWLGHAFCPGREVGFQKFHGTQGLEWGVFSFAAGMNREAACQSISMGAPQIMGFNHARCGYSTAEEMFGVFCNSEEAQVRGMFSFIGANRRALLALRSLDWTSFARHYNGSGQAVAYGRKLAVAYGRAK